MRRFFNTVISVAVSLLVLASCRDQGSNMLEELDSALRSQDTYDSYFRNRVNVLRNILETESDPLRIYDINKSLANEYSAHSFDSTMAYLVANRKIAKAAGDRLREYETEFLMVEEYSLAGYLAEANEIIYGYSEETLPAAALHGFFHAAHVFYGESMAYNPVGSSYYEKLALRDFYRNKLLETARPNTQDWLMLKMEEAEASGRRDEAREYARKAVDSSQPDSREYAKACYFYQNFLKDIPDSLQSRKEWLIRSSIADAKCSTKDYASLQTLVGIIFNEGDVSRAFRYTADYCMPDALFFNGKLRSWQISHFFPQIHRSYEARVAKERKKMVWMLVALSVLLFILALMVCFMVWRQKILNSIREKLQESYLKIEKSNLELTSINSRLSSLNARIRESDKVKEEYIAQFLGILSDNIKKNRQYKNHVLKCIRQGNTDQLVSEIDALPPIDEDILEFYKMFDETFINIYPDFVEQFNSLLVDGAAIVPKGDDILTPEMRIFALIKLGITDSSKIASLLHYSANTIYNYRAKIKNKSKGSRADFEAAIAEIS